MLDFNSKVYAPGARVGANSHYTDIGADGALTDIGTQTHNLNHMDITQADITTATITTLNATTLGAAKTRSIFLQPTDFKVSGSVSAGSTGTYFNALQFVTACPNSTTDPHFGVAFTVPSDAYTSTAMSLYFHRCSNVASASVVHYRYAASYIGSGEAAAPTGASAAGTKTHTTAASANAIEKVTIGTLSTGFAAGDIVFLDCSYYCSGGSNIATSDAIVMAQVDYSSLLSY